LNAIRESKIAFAVENIRNRDFEFQLLAAVKASKKTAREERMRRDALLAYKLHCAENGYIGTGAGAGAGAGAGGDVTCIDHLIATLRHEMEVLQWMRSDAALAASLQCEESGYIGTGIGAGAGAGAGAGGDVTDIDRRIATLRHEMEVLQWTRSAMGSTHSRR
jgi:hypothetical protein